MTAPQLWWTQADTATRVIVFALLYLVAGILQLPTFGERLRYLAAKDELCRFEHDARCWWFARTFLLIWPAWWVWYYAHLAAGGFGRDNHL